MRRPELVKNSIRGWRRGSEASLTTPAVEAGTAALAGTGVYKCCGWADTSGYIFKLDETIKDIPAAGVLTPVRSILTGGSKTVQSVFLEAVNPYVLALYDDVPVFPVTTSPLKPPATPTTPLGVLLPYRADARPTTVYALIGYIDGAKRMRLYAPYAKVTARGNQQFQQGDIVMTDLTFTLYPGTIGTNTGAVAQRTVNYGIDLTTYFT